MVKWIYVLKCVFFTLTYVNKVLNYILWHRETILIKSFFFLGCWHVLGLHLPQTRNNAPSYVPFRRSRHSRRIPPYERLRFSYIQAGEQQERDSLLQVPLQGSYFKQNKKNSSIAWSIYIKVTLRDYKYLMIIGRPIKGSRISSRRKPASSVLPILITRSEIFTMPSLKSNIHLGRSTSK